MSRTGCLNFLNGETEWHQVDTNFDKLSKDGSLHRSDFAECIGMKESKEFALEMFDALCRRRGMKVDNLRKYELCHFWSDITDQSFESRLQLFFNMADKNEDERLNEKEVEEIIMLSAHTNKLPRMKEQAAEYAALMMQELDPDDLGYIEIWQLEVLQKESYTSYKNDLIINLQEQRHNRMSTKALCFLGHNWHLKTTWTYNDVSVLLYGGEKFLRFFRSRIHDVRLLKVAIHPEGALALYMSKPPNFNYKSGQHMFVQCSAVSSFQWRPFSITSAPGDDFLSIHILDLDDWTRKMKVVFSEVCKTSEEGKSGLIEKNWEDQMSLPKLLIDGPYCAPAQDYGKYDVVLLVGLGIGATPFISILKDLVNNIRQEDEEVSSKSKQKNPLRTRKAYFYWVTKEEASFDWFRDIMNEVAEVDHRDIIQIHNYLTSIYEEGDARSAIIRMIQYLNHAKNGVDVVSRTRIRTHFANPNWKEVFSKVGSEHPNARIGVFYSGDSSMVKELRNLCFEYNQTRGTKFEFHKQNF